MTQFKSDARPSDTKSVVLHKENDARLLAHLKTLKRESAFWRTAAYFYLDFMAWLAAQPDAPDPGQPFAVYLAWLDTRALASPVDPESIAAAVLPGVRAIIEAALAGCSLAPSPAVGRPEGGQSEGWGGGQTGLELADLFSTTLVLE